MAKFLVTGIAGFIGSAVARRLIREGHSVTGIDNLSTGFAKNIPESINFIEGNCQDEALYQKLKGESFDAIFHIAGQSSGEISFEDPVYDLETNTKSTLLLLDFAKKTKCQRFIYASSMSVYGDNHPNEPLGEDSFCNPLSFYGVGKLASEHYLRIYEQKGISSTALRLFNVYGPGQNMDNMKQGMVSIFFAMVEKDGHIMVKGCPNRYRDFVYIDDVVECFMLCLERPQSGGKIINVGTGVRTSVASLIDKIRHLSANPSTVEYVGCTEGDMDGAFADISNAAKYLAYDPTVYLDEGLKKMHSWYTDKLKT